jgi:hypothetical protein
VQNSVKIDFSIVNSIFVILIEFRAFYVFIQSPYLHHSVRYGLRRNQASPNFSDVDVEASLHTMSGDVPNMEDRFSTMNNDVMTQRVTFDVSALSTRHVFGANDVASSDEESFAPHFRRRLFEDPLSLLDVDEQEQRNVSVNQVTVDSSQQPNSTTGHTETMQCEGVPEPADDDGDLVAASLLAIGSNPAPRRYRFAYARKYFYATNALYYQNKPGIPPPDEFPEILGQVIQCPNKNNDFNYQIRWLHAKSGGNWPTNLTPHLRTFFPKTELHFQLPFLINECTYNVNRQNGPHALEQERPSRKRQKTNRTTNIVTEVVLSPVLLWQPSLLHQLLKPQGPLRVIILLQSTQLDQFRVCPEIPTVRGQRGGDAA